MRPTDDIKHLIKTLNFKAGPELGERIIRDALASRPDIETTGPGQPRSGIWRKIMKNKLTKFAAAAAILIAVLIGVDRLGGKAGGTNVAWADVIKPLFSARTAVLDIIIGSGAKQSVIHDEVMGSRIRRTVSNIKDTDIILDLAQKKLLTLDTNQKIAVYIGLEGLEETKNYIEYLRNVITSIQKKADFRVENKGLQKCGSRDCLVFIARGDNQTITMWADPKTALPIRIEQKTPNMQIACDNIRFDVPFDESRFSMKAPAGYKVIQNTGFDFSKSSESDFVESLRTWAQIMDGEFPESMKLEDIIKNSPKFGQALERAKLSQQQMVETAMRWGRGLVFIRLFKGQGEWHYAGQGVRMGDSKSAIFWYQPQKSKTWRVIYGDLRVKDVTRDELTKIEADGAARILRYEKQQPFQGRQIDKWHITASGEIFAHCALTVDNFPAGEVKMPVGLPYPAGKFQSAKIAGIVLQYDDLGKGKYELTLPSNWAALDNKTIDIVWTMPLDSLKRDAKSYRVELTGLIPLTAYTLYYVLDDGCGYEFYEYFTSLREARPFWGTAPKPTKYFGSCGLYIRKSK